jgi:hypothetical protein
MPEPVEAKPQPRRLRATILRVILLGVVCWMVSSYIRDYRKSAAVRELLKNAVPTLKPGMTQEDVERLLGVPDNAAQLKTTAEFRLDMAQKMPLLAEEILSLGNDPSDHDLRELWSWHFSWRDPSLRSVVPFSAVFWGRPDSHFCIVAATFVNNRLTERKVKIYDELPDGRLILK